MDADDFVLFGGVLADREDDVERDDELGREGRGADDAERVLLLKPDLAVERLLALAASDSSPSGFSLFCTGAAAAAWSFRTSSRDNGR